MLVRLGPQTQTVLRSGPGPLTMPETTGDQAVDAALAGMARDNPDAADAARAGFGSLTWGEGLDAVTAHSLADFLWYQLPLKWISDLDEKLHVAAALGELFTRLDRPRYAAMCAAPATAQVLAAYEHAGQVAGLKAYRSALAATGVQPPDIPGVIEWGSVMGADEAGAYWAAADALEQAIEAGRLRPGAPGWRKTAEQVTVGFLDSPHDEVTGTTWLQWTHAERLQRWATSRGATRARLADRLVDQLTNPQPIPANAELHLAPVQWLLDHAAAGAQLTQTGNLARAIVAEGCHRFDWLTLTGNPRSESDIVELWTLRELAQQMRVIRRSGRRLLLSSTGKTVHAAGTNGLWQATMACLTGPGEAEAAAAEVALILLLTDGPLDYRALNTAVAQALAHEGWHAQHTAEPIGPDQAGTLLGDLRRRIDLLNLADGERFIGPTRLNDAGHNAAHVALRSRALRPRTSHHA